MRLLLSVIGSLVLASAILVANAQAKPKPGDGPDQSIALYTPLPTDDVVLDGGGGGGSGCWTIDWYEHDSTITGSWAWHVIPHWCGNGAWVTALNGVDRYPYVSGWYGFDRDDGAWITGGCVGYPCGYVTVEARGEFRWANWMVTNHYTHWIEIQLDADGNAYLVSYN